MLSISETNLAFEKIIVYTYYATAIVHETYFYNCMVKIIVCRYQKLQSGLVLQCVNIASY